MTPGARPPDPAGNDTTFGVAGAEGVEDCDGLAVLVVTPDAIEVMRKGSALPRRSGKVDAAALREELEPADENAACAHAVDIGARGNVTYQDLVEVMDVAVAVGRTEVGLFGKRTALYPTKRRPKQPTDEEFLAQLSKPKFDPAVAPILVISTTSIVLRLAVGPEKEIVVDDVAPLGDEPALQHLQERLREARSVSPAASEDAFVLQADRTTAAQIVIDVSAAARAAGYSQILFAIQNRGGTP